MRLSENSGGPAVPRNEGFKISRGKYIFFMDDDDILIDTALEEMFSAAEEFKADIVYCERYFMSEGIGEEFKKNVHVADRHIQPGEFVSKPTVVSTDLRIRIEEWVNARFWVTPWLRLSSREFLVQNNIQFPLLHGQDDNGWAFFGVCLAKTFVRLPNLCYVRRMSSDSLSSFQKSPEKLLYHIMEKTIKGIKEIDDFMGRIDFFVDNPAYRYAVLQKWTMDDLYDIFTKFYEVPDYVIGEIFRNQFGTYLGEHSVLVSQLFTNSIALMKHLALANEKIEELTGSPL